MGGILLVVLFVFDPVIEIRKLWSKSDTQYTLNFWAFSFSTTVLSVTQKDLRIRFTYSSPDYTETWPKI